MNQVDGQDFLIATQEAVDSGQVRHSSSQNFGNTRKQSLRKVHAAVHLERCRAHLDSTLFRIAFV
jgi:hypothetical protein